MVCVNAKPEKLTILLDIDQYLWDIACFVIIWFASMPNLNKSSILLDIGQYLWDIWDIASFVIRWFASMLNVKNVYILA